MKFKDLFRSGHSAYKNNFIVRIMKLTILLMTTFLMQVSAAGFAQKVTFTKKDASLKQLFTEIRTQTGYNVFWQEGKVDDELKFNAAFKNTPLAEVLDKALIPQSLTYTIVNKTVVVKRKEVQFLDKVKNFFTSVNANGKIIDAETSKGIPQATVILKGTNRMVVADENGNFRFYSLPADGILIFSSVGYISQEVTVSAAPFIKLVLATKVLDDVIVSTGYQQIKKGSTTGSYTVIDADEIAKTPSVNLMERLEGKVPGVQFDIRNNTIQIRGVSGYVANPPLIIIDGFPAIDQKLTTVTTGTVSGSVSFNPQPATSGNAILSTFNPSDIESITFLKDAAATSIWGAAAANGVIVITTKRGKKGKSSINFSAALSSSAPANFKNLTSMTNRQYLDLEQELVDKGFVTDPVTSNPTSGIRAATPVSEAEQWMLRAKSNPSLVGKRDSALNVLANRSNRDQLRDYMLQRAMSQQYNLSFSGGADNSSYYVAGSYTKDQPVFRSNVGESYSVLSNLTNDFLNKRITLSTGLNYTYSRSQVNSAALQALSIGQFGMAPYQMLVDPNGNKVYSGITLNKNVSDSLTRTLKLLPWTYNPIDELNYNNTISTKNAIRVNASLKGVITDWLNISVSGQVQKGISDQVLLQNQNSYYMRDLINTGTSFTNGVAKYGVPKGGIYNTSGINTDDYGLRTQLNVNKNWNDIHHFDMIAGTEIRQSKATGSNQTLYGYNEDVSSSVNVNTTSTGSYTSIFGDTRFLPSPNNTIFRSTRRYLSYYSNATYSFKGKYYATASARFDDINILGVSRKDRATPLWSAGLRWDIKKEKFMKDIRWINSLSLRGTLGTSGNPPAGSQNYSTIAVGQVDSYSQLPVAYISSPANQQVKWETTKTINGGVDASLFNNRLDVTVDVYRKRTYDLLLSLPVNGTYGYTSLSYNAGDLSGHGTEVNLTGHVIRTRDFGWVSNFNISYNTNKVTDTRFPARLVNGGSSAITTGYAVDNLFVYRWAGLDNKGQSQIYKADGSIVSSTSTTAITPEDLVYAGRTTAPYFGGFTNTFRYKNLSLSARATYYLGNKFLLQTINSSFYPSGNSYGGGLLSNNAALADRWRNPGDEAHTNIPGLSNTNFNSINRYVNSDVNIRDAGNIRLQQVSLNYTVPESMLRKTPFIKSLTVGATVSNLGLLWVANKEGIDPAYQMTSSFNNLPPARNYVLSFNLSL